MNRMITAFFPDGARVVASSLPQLWMRFSQCSVPYITVPAMASVSGLTFITYPTVLLFALGGFMIGVLGAKQCFALREQLLRGAKLSRSAAFSFYGLSFLCFAAMNLSAMFAHSLFPPAVYVEGVMEVDAAAPPPPEGLTYTAITHIAHVLDICSTCCSCVCFIVGRLMELHILDAHNMATTRSATLLVLAIYLLGFVGLHPPAVPFLGEALYPGVCGLMPVVVPLLQWPEHKRSWLSLAVIVFVCAFLAGALEGQLCGHLGDHWTAPAVCFAMCDVLFIILAGLIGVKIV